MNISKSQPPGLIVTTDLIVISRHLALFDEIRARELTPLFVVGPQTTREQLAALRRDDPSHPLAAAAHLIHADDYTLDTLLRHVQGYLRDYTICGVLNVGELFVQEAAVLAECLGLPGVGAFAGRVCRNKLLQRIAAPALTPRWEIIDLASRTAASAWDHYPAVVKPTRRMSSSGVVRVDDDVALLSALDQYEADETVLVEELITGPELSVETLVHGGEIVWAGITAKTTNETTSRFFTEIAHTSPADTLSPELERVLLDANAQLLAALRFQSGMSHAEFRLQEGRAVLMEIAARPPGDAITRLWQMACGSALEPALLDLALGKRPHFEPASRRARQVYLEHPYGTLDTVEADQADGLPIDWIAGTWRWPDYKPAAVNASARCCGVIVTREPGAILGPQTDSGERSASIVVDAPLTADINEVARTWAGRIRILVR
ncbi:ATP-grasp domain-containing protein [Burkholderia glumae]